MNGALELIVQSEGLERALAMGPRVLEKHVDPAVGRAGLEISRSERRYAPKAFSLLTHSIHVERPSPYEAIISAGADYARAVERGTHGGHFPPLKNIEAWVRVRRIVPNDQTLSERDLVFMIARAIARHGTPAQPFAAPALADNRQRTIERINAAVGAALEELSA